MKLLYTLILFSCFLSSIHSYEPDRVIKLPGRWPKFPFKLYSGYLDANNGAHLHYVFVESQSSPSTDPVILWLNGGPGCSSMVGLFTEIGPYLISSEGYVASNPFSWNKIANLLFLESPVGVGFSYSDDGKIVDSNDEKTALDNLLAVKNFFKKFPQFSANEFFLSGQSYAGIYIPTLSVLLLNESSINYKGFTIGNGYYDRSLLAKSSLFFFHYHGFIDELKMENYTHFCCSNNSLSRKNCYVDYESDDCFENLQNIDNFISILPLDRYNIYHDCPQIENSVDSLTQRQVMINLIASKNVLLKSPTDCLGLDALKVWLNLDGVRAALNIPTKLPKWAECNYKIFIAYNRTVDSMANNVLKSIEAGKRGIIYNGDFDSVCDFISGQWFSEDLKLPKIGEYLPWMVNGVLGGMAQRYQGLTFATIRGAGHSVPKDKPASAFELIKSFITDKPLN